MKHNFFYKLRFVKIKDIIHLLYFIIAFPLAKIYRLYRKELWLICEYENEARDNGYYLFRHLRRNHKEIDAVYAINKSCRDYRKVDTIGKTVQYGGLLHWIFYLAAEVNISSQKGGKPNAAVCYLLEVYGIIKNTRVFLQHGVIMNDLPYLHYKNSKVRLFMCSSEKERAFVIDAFGYPEEYVVNTGLCRFDALIDERTTSQTIFVCPTWRSWIAHPVKESNEIEDISDFKKTRYYKYWSQLLMSSELNELLAEKELQLIFCPHRNMAPFIKDFQSQSPRVKIVSWEEEDIHKRITSSDMIITDYSSISMDFAYQDKPLIYYQFDKELFHKAHQPSGYFDYHEDGFGPVCDNINEVLKSFKEAVENGLRPVEKYKAKIDEFFILRDSNNCERNYAAIKKAISEVRRLGYERKNRFRSYMGRRQRPRMETRER
ncbi:CDP-glycerol glycerophosphotransferase family protein [Alloiococcus sp. CFN-8]|uniref:CDP-glycerol glycerophosphotransferase family protein n=1 Tax=Alloiococcus sp. CFN-8 TaxID=3416081 RepID=UPI003CED039D